MELSVIIPTCNRSNCLVQALASIAGQTFARDRFELIVVDNAPHDETADITGCFKGKIAYLRYIAEPLPGLHNARHRGMREARSERLVFVDDDIEATPEWLAGVWEGFTNYDAVMVGGKNIPKWECDPPEWVMHFWDANGEANQSLGYLSVLDFGDSIREIDPSYIYGCNFSILRSVLLEAGGFHPDSMPEELLRLRGDGESHISRYVSAKGLKAIYHPRASVYHKVPTSRMTLEYFRKRAFSQGVSDSYTMLRCGWVGKHPIPGLWFVCRFLHGGVFGYFFRKLVSNSQYIRLLLEESYWQGYHWYLELFNKDESLREWVMRPDYLET